MSADRHRLPSLTALRAFDAAAHQLSFKQAAEQLSLTPTAISHQIRQLEQELGTPLFHRLPRRVALTDAGMQLHRAVHRAFADIGDAVAGLRQQQVQHAVLLSTTRAFATCWLLPRLPQAQRTFAGIGITLHASDAPIAADARDAVLAVRYGRGPFPGWLAEPLLPGPFVAVTSPVLARRIRRQSPRTWPRLQFDWHRRDRSTPDWDKWFAQADVTPTLAAVARFSDEAHAIQAAVAGQGVLLASVALVADSIAAGILEALPGPVLPGHAFQLLRASGQSLQPQIDQVATWLGDQAQAWHSTHARLLSRVQTNIHR